MRILFSTLFLAVAIAAVAAKKQPEPGAREAFGSIYKGREIGFTGTLAQKAEALAPLKEFAVLQATQNGDAGRMWDEMTTPTQALVTATTLAICEGTSRSLEQQRRALEEISKAARKEP